MNSNIIEMLENLSRSLFPIQHLVSGLSYVLGILLFFTALQKFRKLGESGSTEGMFGPTAYMLGGVALLFLPSMLSTASNTVFGAGNILSYSRYNPNDLYSAIILLIRTAGLIWFVRGSVLLTHSSESGVKGGAKGLVFVFAGILSMNFETTVGVLTWLMSEMTQFTLSSTSKQT